MADHPSSGPTDAPPDARESLTSEEEAVLAAAEPATADSPSQTPPPSAASAGKDALRYLPTRIVPAAVALISVPILTAAISPGAYGAYYLIASVATLLSAGAVGWLGSAAVRFYWPARREHRLDEYLASVFWSGLAALCVAAVLAGAATWLLRGQLSREVLVLVPSALLFLVPNFLTDVLSQVLRTAKNSKVFARVQIVGSLLSTAIAVALVWFTPLGAAGIFIGGAIGWTLMFIPILRALSLEGSFAPSHVDRPMLGEFVRYGLPLVPVGLATWVLVFIDRFMVEAFRGTAEVGLYSVAYSLGERFMMLATAPLLLAIVPTLMEAFENHGQAAAEQTQQQSVRYFALVTFPLLAGIAVTAPVVMRVFTSPDYWSAWPVLAVIAAGSLFSGFSQVATSGLALHKKTAVIMTNILIASAFNVIANVVFIPRYGYMAAAYTTLGAWLIMMLLSWWRSRSYMPLRLPYADLGRVLAATLVMAAVVWLPMLLGQPTRVRLWSVALLAGQAVLGVIVYAGAAVLFKAVTAHEVTSLRRLVLKR